MTQTKAAKIIEALLDNDLAASVYKAIKANDYQAFVDALDDASLAVEDLTLSSEEFTNFVRGVKPSGELDIVTWEGYYEVTSPRNGDGCLAFLILSSTKKVYWGSREEVLGEPANHVVDYTLTTNGKVEFSTSTDGKVSIELTREYDDDAGTVKVEFKGTRNEDSMSGRQTTPPLYHSAGLPATTNNKISRVAFVAAAEDGSGQVYKVWSITWDCISTIFTLISWGVAVLQVLIWIRDKEWRPKSATRLEKICDEEALLLKEVGEMSCDPPKVDFKNAGAKVTGDIISRINQELADDPPDYLTKTVQEITERLRAAAEAEAQRSTRSYVRSRILASIAQTLAKFEMLPDFDDFAKDVEDRLVGLQADPKIQELGPSTSYDMVVRPVVLNAQALYLRSDYARMESLYNGAEQEYEAAKKYKEKQQTAIDEVDKEIEEDKKKGNEDKAKNDQARRDRLGEELDRAKSDESDKKRKRDEAEEKKNDAKRKNDQAEEDAKRDNSRAGWDGKVGEVFK